MVRRDVDPGLRHRVEHAVGVVEAPVLQAQHALGDLRERKIDQKALRCPEKCGIRLREFKQRLIEQSTVSSNLFLHGFFCPIESTSF